MAITTHTTSGAVESILLNDYDGVSPLHPFIEAAAMLVARLSQCAIDRGAPLSADEIEILERWLAAHYYATSDRPYVAKKTADASATFMVKQGLDLQATPYGQAALTLDSSGCLDSLTSPGKKARGAWLGRNPSRQTDYINRR